MSAWEPGDVALVPFPSGDEVCLRTTHGWIRTNHASPGKAVKSYMGARSLFVIDPEDDEQVERLTDALGQAFFQVDPDGYEDAPEADAETSRKIVFCALALFARPTPRIEEPQGLGAVVEDQAGVKWVRAGKSYTDPNWRRAGGDQWYRFADTNAVRVLSHGVTEGES